MHLITCNTYFLTDVVNPFLLTCVCVAVLGMGNVEHRIRCDSNLKVFGTQNFIHPNIWVKIK